LIHEFDKVAQNIEKEMQVTPIFVPLDFYSINSELSYYQGKLLSRHQIQKTYPISGAGLFGLQSLMYSYWFNDRALAGKVLILISTKLSDFTSPKIGIYLTSQSTIHKIWAHSQGGQTKARPFYYRVVRVRNELVTFSGPRCSFRGKPNYLTKSGYSTLNFVYEDS